MQKITVVRVGRIQVSLILTPSWVRPLGHSHRVVIHERHTWCVAYPGSRPMPASICFMCLARCEPKELLFTRDVATFSVHIPSYITRLSLGAPINHGPFKSNHPRKNKNTYHKNTEERQNLIPNEETVPIIEPITNTSFYNAAHSKVWKINVGENSKNSTAWITEENRHNKT